MIATLRAVHGHEAARRIGPAPRTKGTPHPMFRPHAAVLLGSLAIFAAGCGEDEDSGDTASTPTTTTETTPARGYATTALTDVEPRTSKPNIAGGNAPIEEFAQRAGNDASDYFGRVFESSQIPYEVPTISVESETIDFCEQQFDPAAQAFYLCATQGGSEIAFGAPRMEELRSGAGDAAVAFLAGLAVAADANDQLSGRPIAQGEQPTAGFIATATCFTGAWVRNLADRELVEAGDDEEVLAAAADYFGSDAQLGQDALRTGYTEGAGACQQADAGEDAAEPAPSPSGE